MMEPGISLDTTADPSPAQDRPSSAGNANIDSKNLPQAGMTNTDHLDLSSCNTMEITMPRSQQDKDANETTDILSKHQSEHQSNEAVLVASAKILQVSREQNIQDPMPIQSLQAEDRDSTPSSSPSKTATLDVNPEARAIHDPSTRQTTDNHPAAVEQPAAQLEPNMLQAELTSQSGSCQTSNHGDQLLTFTSDQSYSRQVIDFGDGLLQGSMAASSLELRNESTVGADVSCWLDSLGASEGPTPLLSPPGRQLQRRASVLQVRAHVSEDCSPDAIQQPFPWSRKCQPIRALELVCHLLDDIA